MSEYRGLESGRLRFERGRRKKEDRAIIKGSVDGVFYYFRNKMEESGFGAVPPLTKDVRNKLRSFLKLIDQENDVEWTYQLIDDMIFYWRDFKSMEFTTLQGKVWIIGPRPSLKDLLICRESLIANIEALKTKADREDNSQIDFAKAMYRRT